MHRGLAEKQMCVGKSYNICNTAERECLTFRRIWWQFFAFCSVIVPPPQDGPPHAPLNFSINQTLPEKSSLVWETSPENIKTASLIEILTFSDYIWQNKVNLLFLRPKCSMHVFDFFFLWESERGNNSILSFNVFEFENRILGYSSFQYANEIIQCSNI